jgi:MoxR-like ATPase
MIIQTIDDLQLALRQQFYIADHGLAPAIFLAFKLKRPLFLEGEAGVGKTEVAKVIAGLKSARLIRLQCYKGLDVNQAVYEWNYTRQMLHTKVPKAPAVLAQQVTAFIQELRRVELYKVPGVAETLDWIAALLALDQQALEPQVVDDTLGVILKYQDDVSRIKGKATQRLVEKVGKLN